MTSLSPAVFALVATCGVIGIAFLLLLASIARVRAAKLLSLEAFLIGFLGRLALLFFNEQYLLFEHKVAGERSVDFYLKCIAGDGQFVDLLRDQFALQVLINTPFFAIFGASLLTVMVTNCLFGAMTAPLVSMLLCKPFGERIARRAMLLFFAYPASINFSLFGLRDALIFFFMAVFVAAAVIVYAGHSRRLYSSVSACSCLCLLLLRPEMSYVVIALVGMLMVPWLKTTIATNQRPIEKLATVGAFAAIVLIGGGLLGIASLKVAAMQIGASSINPLEFAGEQAEERFARAEQMGKGGGTHLLSADSYANMPVYLRVPIQTVGLIVLPFPWMITGVAQLLAFVDSLILIAIMILSVKVSWSHRKGSPVVWALLVAFCIGILGMGLIVSNAGNGFRMRFGIVPLLLVAGAFCRSIPVFRLRD